MLVVCVLMKCNVKAVALPPSQLNMSFSENVNMGSVWRKMLHERKTLSVTRGSLHQELSAAEAVVLAAMQRPDRCIHLLRPGRLVKVRADTVDWGWGVVVSVLHTPPRAEGACAGFARLPVCMPGGHSFWQSVYMTGHHE